LRGESEGFSGGNQPAVVDHSQLVFPAASQAHLRSGCEGKWEASDMITTKQQVGLYLSMTGLYSMYLTAFTLDGTKHVGLFFFLSYTITHCIQWMQCNSLQ